MPNSYRRLKQARAGYAPRRRPNRFVRKLKSLAISALITVMLSAGACLEAGAITGLLHENHAHQRIANDRVTQECDHAR